jgi:O-antigen/teichoic acid export membrane protein
MSISRFPLSKFVVWVRRALFAIADQGLISGSNFVLNVMLARWLNPEEYGAFALASAIFILVLGIYQALILEPMPVVVSTARKSRAQYLGAMLRIQLPISLIVAAGFGAAALIGSKAGGNRAMNHAFAGLAVSAPMTLLLWFGRCGCYLDFAGQRAASAAFVYAAVLFSSAYLLWAYHLLSTLNVLLVMGLASGIVGVILTVTLRPALLVNRATVLHVWKEHWNFGRWELSKVGFDWISENVAAAITAPILGMAGVGTLKAMLTLFLPLSHMLTALRRLVLPKLALDSSAGDAAGTRDAVLRLNFAYVLFASAYGILLSVFARPLLHLAYKGRYDAAAGLVPFISIALLFGIPAHGYDIGVRALRFPRAIFTCSALSASAAAAFSIPLVRAFGLPGAVGTILIASAVSFVTLRTAFRRCVRKRMALEAGQNIQVLSETIHPARASAAVQPSDLCP